MIEPAPKGAATILDGQTLFEIIQLFPPDCKIWIGQEAEGRISSVSYHPEWPIGSPDGGPTVLLNQNWKPFCNLNVEPTNESCSELRVMLKDVEITTVSNAHPAIDDAIYYLGYFLEHRDGAIPPYMVVFNDARVAYAKDEDGSGVNIGLYWIPTVGMPESEQLIGTIHLPWSL